LVTFGGSVGNGSVDFGVHQSIEVLHTLDSAGFWDESALSGILGFGEFQPDSVVLVESTETVGQWVGGWVDAWHASEEWRLSWSMSFPFWCIWVSVPWPLTAVHTFVVSVSVLPEDWIGPGWHTIVTDSGWVVIWTWLKGAWQFSRVPPIVLTGSVFNSVDTGSVTGGIVGGEAVWQVFPQDFVQSWDLTANKQVLDLSGHVGGRVSIDPRSSKDS
jgi:hypothetical protein